MVFQSPSRGFCFLRDSTELIPGGGRLVSIPFTGLLFFKVGIGILAAIIGGVSIPFTGLLFFKEI